VATLGLLVWELAVLKRLEITLVLCLCAAAVAASCKKSPAPGSSDAGPAKATESAASKPASSVVLDEQSPGALSCKRVAAAREDCHPGNPCPPERILDFKACAEFVHQNGLTKNPY
jgi:hypothetical protein